MDYALVAPDDTITLRRRDTELDLSAGVKAGYRWLPIENVSQDTSTLAPDFCTHDPVQTSVLVDKVQFITTKRDMTTQEQNAAKDALVLNDVDRLIGKVLFNHENRIRILEGKQPINRNQFISALKALL